MSAATDAPLLIYGGTFDPVHDGHVAIARAAADALAIDQVLLIPAGAPPHRAPPRAAAPLRAEMLRRAFAGDPRFVVDERELRRDAPSYTVDTLASLRAEFGPQRPLVLLLGADAFLGLPSWHRWQEVPRLAHLAVFARPGVRLAPGSADWPAGVAAPSDDPARLRETPAGECLLLPMPVSSVSSTAVRAAFARGERDPPGVPAAVAELLQAAGDPYREAVNGES
jgi:nicotinate-nucleotide adenylyltransferase